MRCPDCDAVLSLAAPYACPSGHGAFLPSEGFLEVPWGVLVRVQGASVRGERACPGCREEMYEIHLARDGEAFTVDVCFRRGTQGGVWLDAGEAEKLLAREGTLAPPGGWLRFHAWDVAFHAFFGLLSAG